MNNKLALAADTDTRGYMLAMNAIRKDALPSAVADTLNDTANAVTKQQIYNVKKDLIVRTKYTTNSMQRQGHAINLAKGKSIDRMFSRAGSFSPYLWIQEENRKVEGLNGPKPIPTLAARTAKSLQRSIRKAYRLNRNQSLKPGAFGQSGYERFFAGKPKGGDRAIGLYERSANNKKLTMIRNLESDVVNIKGIHFHENAVKKYGTQQYMSAKFRKRALMELKRKGVA